MAITEPTTALDRVKSKSRQLAESYENEGIDPFSRAPAGYSLTGTPNKWPWEKPPKFVDVEEAFDNIRGRMMKGEERFDLLRLMDSGIPIETLVRTAVFGAFTRGLVTPDVAEMLVPPLSVHLLIDARRSGISPKFNNNVKLDILPQEKIFDIMKELNPERYEEYLSGKALQEPNEEKQGESSDVRSKMKGFMLANKVEEQNNGN